MLKELHWEHPGICGMKAIARTCVWWPKMDEEIEEAVKCCSVCQSVRSAPPCAPLIPWKWPTRPFQRVHINFCQKDIAQRGMIPRSMELVFKTSNQLQEKGWEYKMEASFLEIYNENIRDLLGSDDSVKYEIKMVDNGKTNVENSEVMVTNLKIVDVTDQQQVYSLLKTAAQNRAVGATKCNERSSRSHSVFTLKLTGKNHLTHEKCQGMIDYRAARACCFVVCFAIFSREVNCR